MGALAGLAGLASLLIARPVGYDAYAWLVWGRELAHGALQTQGGPAFKALPVIVAAPLSVLGDAAPLVWLAAMRAAALLALLVAYRLGTRIAGRAAGLTAAFVIAAGPDLVRTAAYGSSEPLLVLLVLLAAERWADDRPDHALALLGAGGLLRPELWPLVAGLAIVLAVRDRPRAIVALAAIAPPVIWLGMSWAGSGTPFGDIHGFSRTTGCAGCGVLVALPRALVTLNEHTDALGVLRRLTESIVLPALALSVLALATARPRAGRMKLVGIGAFALAWVAVVAVMAQAGYPGSRRYLVAPAALLAVLAGVGMADALRASARGRGRAMVAVIVGGLLAAASAPAILSSLRLAGTARREQRALADVRGAARRAGGRGAIPAGGRVVVNPWVQTALAWDLGVPLARVQPMWHGSRRRPRWTPPALVFSGPRDTAGPRPALPARRPTIVVLRFHGWTLRRATQPDGAPS